VRQNITIESLFESLFALRDAFTTAAMIGAAADIPRTIGPAALTGWCINSHVVMHCASLDAEVPAIADRRGIL
jgi:hypothetical protein